MKTRFFTFAFRLSLLLLISAALAVLALYGLWQHKLKQPLDIPPAGLVYEVPVGASLQQVARGLERAGVIDRVLWIRIYARLNPESARIQAGEYQLTAGMTLPQLIELFGSGRTLSYPIQFLEGWTFADVRRELGRHAKLEAKTHDLTDDAVMALLGRPGQHPEGLFFPDTYRYHKGMSDLEILRQAMQRMDVVLQEEWERRASELPLKTPYQGLILASIVEKETGVPEERAEIAGVFVRRLMKGMRLQTDPTVIYGLGERYAGNLTRRHLSEHNAYNTYRISGLPPTPIALPGREAIHAALNPAAGDALYFVARGDGTHEFNATYEGHRRAVVKYQIQQRRADYRSRPLVSDQDTE